MLELDIEKVKQLMEQKNLNTTKLALKMQIASQQVVDLLDKKKAKNRTLKTISKLAHALEVSAKEILREV